MTNQRDIYIDNVRVFLTALVILHHAAVTYGAPGSWYYNEPATSLVPGLLLTVFVATNQSFFMGLFFFLSAYYMPAAYVRKGPGRFMNERLKRLGIPIIFYSLVIAPVTIYAVIAHRHVNISFVDYYLHRDNWVSVGVLWFTAALLIFSAVYVLALGNKPPSAFPQRPAPSNVQILAFALVLGLVSFVVRIFFPIGWTVPLLGFQLAHFTQYIALFIAGLAAQRSGWLQSLTAAQGRLWLAVAAGLVVIGFPLIYLLKEITGADLQTFMGGFTVQSFGNAMWEQLLGVSLVVGVLSIAKERFNVQGRGVQNLSRAAYAVYIIHPLVLVLVSLSIAHLNLPALVKFVVAGTVAVVASFVAGRLLLRVPFVGGVV